MKCPKCGYLGFEDADRCRNCGYDFSLAAPIVVPELPLRLEPPVEKPLEDLQLAAPVPASGERPDAANPIPEPRRPVVASPQLPAPSKTELPLFSSSLVEPDDAPLITRVSAPRTPLSVRRATPELPRVRGDQPRAQSFELTPDDSGRPHGRSAMSSADSFEADAARDERSPLPAGVFARLIAVVIDIVILAIIDAVVVYFTLRILGLTLDDLSALPTGPMVAFLLVQNGGYLVAFTAGGQTLGKMAAGIRVVASEPDAPLDVSHAFVREALWLLLAAPAGLGLLPALFSRDGRGLHDRLAGTRVVR